MRLFSNLQPDTLNPAVSEISFDIDSIQMTVRRRPKGYLKELLSIGRVENGRLWFDLEDYYSVKDKYEPNWRDKTVTITLGNTPNCKTCAPAAT